MKCHKLNVCLHHNCSSALGHPSVWAGIAGVLTSTGAELDKPFSVVCFVLSALCSVAAILIRGPHDGPMESKPEEECTWKK